MWEWEKDLENAKKTVDKFKERKSTEVREQENLDITEERVFRREELPERYTVKILYEWDNEKFENEYLRKLERIRQKSNSVSLKEKS